MLIEILLALTAGILTIAAPCILLPLPIILGTSVGQRSKTRPIFITLGFIFTFTVLALLIQFIISHLGLNPNILRFVAVVLLAVFAIFMIWPTPFEKLMVHLNPLINRAGQVGQQNTSGNWSGLLIGIIIGIVWAPCAGPILGSILTLIALKNNIDQASVLLIAYAIGAGIPMLAIAYGGQALTTKVKSIAKYSHVLQQIFGVILLLLAISIYFQYDIVIQAKLLAALPNFSEKLESNLTQSLNNNTLSPEQNEPTETGKDKDPIIRLTDPDMQKNMPLTLQNYGKAPEFTGIYKWLNLPDGKDSLTLNDLKGKVVLIDFWTYSCINCIRTLPYVTKWYDTYKDKGFVVVGVHTPEFAFEKDTNNVATALKQHGINYPVAQDNDYGTWQAYNNQYWPAHYLIDKQGNIVYEHFGEGEYDTTERVIQQLLAVKMPDVSTTIPEETHSPLSPEMYFGNSRRVNLSKAQTANSTDTIYKLPSNVDFNNFAVSGTWKFDDDKAVCTKAPCTIRLHYAAKDVHIVAHSTQEAKLQILIDGNKKPAVPVLDYNLYNLFSGQKTEEHTIDIQIPTDNFEVFTFTFG